MVDPLDTFARRIATPLRDEPARPDDDFTERVMQAIAAHPVGVRTAQDRPAAVPGPTTNHAWWRRRWQLSVTPIGVLAAAASLFVLLRVSGNSHRTERPLVAAVASDSAVRVVRFELLAPPTARVSLVGAFNGWDANATPLVRSVGAPDGSGRVRFSVALPLSGGRHEYAFVLDDSTWLPDPEAASTLDEFGTRTSVVVVEAPRQGGA